MACSALEFTEPREPSIKRAWGLLNPRAAALTNSAPRIHDLARLASSASLLKSEISGARGRRSPATAWAVVLPFLSGPKSSPGAGFDSAESFQMMDSICDDGACDGGGVVRMVINARSESPLFTSHLTAFITGIQLTLLSSCKINICNDSLYLISDCGTAQKIDGRPGECAAKKHNVTVSWGCSIINVGKKFSVISGTLLATNIGTNQQS